VRIDFVIYRYSPRAQDDGRTPLFTAAVILTVMLAMGANTTIFSVVNAVLLRPLPFREPDRLAQISEKNDKLNLPTFSSSILNFVS
jgi:putative ABC transport system permease protein